MSKKTINICLTCDDNYIEHMYVTMYSTIVNLNRNVDSNFWILDGGLSNHSKTMILSLQDKFEGIKIYFKPVDLKKYSNFPSFCGTYQTYFRFDIPNLLTDIDKVLYLDPDIVVNGDISDLFDLDLSNYAIAAPTSINIYYYYYYTLKIPKTYGYFNGGVMLMNLEFMREKDLVNSLFAYINNNLDKIVSFDQDALNAVLYDKRLEIGLEYNIIFLVSYKLFSKHKNNVHPVIIHYGSSYKPWEKYCIHLLDYEYHYYRKLSGLPDIKFDKTFKLKAWLKSRFDFFVWHFSIRFPHIFSFVGFVRFKILKLK